MSISENKKWNHTGAILAGGKSRRMGMAKPDILLSDGRSMLEHVIEPLSAVCKQIVIVGEWENRKNKKGIIQIADHISGLGPLEGIETLLSSNLDSEYLVVACDQPFLTTELLWRLVEESSSNLRLFKFKNDEEIQPFPGYYPVNCLLDIQNSTKRRMTAMHEFINNTKVDWIHLSETKQYLVKSINTPEELKDMIKIEALRK